MKKLFLISLVLVSVFAANAASYRQMAALDKGLNPLTADTVNVTYNERIYVMHRVVCGNMADSVFGWRKTDFANNTSFSDPAYVEFIKRGLTGGMRQDMESLLMGSSNVNNNLGNCTDTQLQDAYKNRMWGAIRLIDLGK